MKPHNTLPKTDASGNRGHKVKNSSR